MTPSPVPHEAVAPVPTAINTHFQWLRNKGSIPGRNKKFFSSVIVYSNFGAQVPGSFFFGAKAAKA
jgi:hypothetical protein